VNETRVADIKTALEAGEYKVNPERIADKMLQMELKLPNST
jgi:flagellar biosynthesis anti-sigma factor FlgM